MIVPFVNCGMITPNKLAALDYDALRRAATDGRRTAGGPAVLDQKHNVLLTGSTRQLRDWLRAQGDDVFGEATGFEKN